MSLSFELHRALSLPAALLLCAPLTSALPQQGPASSLASGLTLRSTAATINATPVWLNPPLSSTPALPAAAFAVPIGQPDYSLGALFPTLFASIEIDALSTGNAIIPNRRIGPNGPEIHPNLETAERWMELVVSYGPPAGEPNGAYYPPLLAGRPNPNSDLIGFFLENSNLIEESLIGSVRREQSAASMSFNADEDIASLDFGAGVRFFSPGAQPGGLFARSNELYFSLTPRSAQAVNTATTSNFTINGLPADAASIFRLTWDGTTWSEPFRVFSAETLDLDPLVDDVDALSVDPDTSNLIFSTTVVPGRSQLQYHTSNPPMTTALGDGGSGLATDAMGGDDDTTDIDAACVIEPPEYATSSHYGTAYADRSIITGGMGLSVTREDDELLLEATGMANDVAGEFVVFGAQVLGAVGALNPASWSPLGFEFLAPGQDVAELRFPIAASGGLIGLQAFNLDATARLVDQSWSVVVSL